MSDFRMMHTPQGEQLLAQVHAGVPMQLTRVVLGNGIWTAAEQSSHDLTGLKAQRMSLAITGVTQSGDEAEVTAMLDNSALDAGFSCTEMGVYARPVIGEGGGEEILYMAGYLEPAKSSFVHSKNGTPMLIPVTVTIVVAGSGEVTIAFKNDFYYVTKSDLTKHDTDPNAHGVLLDSVRAHAPLVVISGSADIWEGESTQLLIQDWHTYEWASEVKVRITDAGGADRTALWAVAPNLTTGRIDLTAPQVDADQTYSVAVQVWEHGLVRSRWTQPLTINVGDVPINRPAITAPAAGATGVGETPTITTGAFSADADQTHADTQMQIATDTGFAAVVRDTGSLGPVTAYDVPPGILTTGHVYYVRARHKGSDGNWSPWSPVSSFFTAASFIYVDRPVNTSPVAGAGEMGETPTLAASAYSTNGTGNHVHSRFQVDVAGGDFSAPVHDSGLLGAVTEYAIPAGVLDVATQYTWRVQYTDDSAGPIASEWSSPTAFTTAAIFGVPWATWNEADEATLAHPDCFVVKFENPNSGGNELGQGGPDSIDSRLLTQYANVPGATATGRKLGDPMTTQQRLTLDSNMAQLMLAGDFTIILRLNKAVGGWDGSYHPHIFRFESASEVYGISLYIGGLLYIHPNVLVSGTGIVKSFNITQAQCAAGPTLWFAIQYDAAAQEIFYGAKMGGAKPIAKADFTQFHMTFPVAFKPSGMGRRIDIGGNSTYYTWTADYDYFVVARSHLLI